jgi:hypothetical protein
MNTSFTPLVGHFRAEDLGQHVPADCSTIGRGGQIRPHVCEMRALAERSVSRKIQVKLAMPRRLGLADLLTWGRV